MRKPTEIRAMKEAAIAASKAKGWAVTVVEDTVAETLAWVLGERASTLPYHIRAAAELAAENSRSKHETR